MDKKIEDSVKERVELSKDLADEVFLQEYNSMLVDVENFNKQQEHLKGVLSRATRGRELTERVQIEARKNPGRIQPIFNFENDTDWQVANAELAHLKQDVELMELDSEIRTLTKQLDTCNVEVERLQATVAQFEIEKKKRGI